MTTWISGWLTAFCVMEIATGHLWLAVVTGVTALVLIVVARLAQMDNLEARIRFDDLDPRDYLR